MPSERPPQNPDALSVRGRANCGVNITRRDYVAWKVGQPPTGQELPFRLKLGLIGEYSEV
jgi:hypothetical protein